MRAAKSFLFRKKERCACCGEPLDTKCGEDVLRRADLSTAPPGAVNQLFTKHGQHSWILPSFFNDFSPQQGSQDRINGLFQVFNQHHISSFQGMLYDLKVPGEKGRQYEPGARNGFRGNNKRTVASEAQR